MDDCQVCQLNGGEVMNGAGSTSRKDEICNGCIDAFALWLHSEADRYCDVYIILQGSR